MKALKKILLLTTLTLFISPSFAQIKKEDAYIEQYNKEEGVSYFAPAIPLIIGTEEIIRNALIGGAIVVGTVAAVESIKKNSNDDSTVVGGHENGARPSTTNKHEKGESRRKMEQGGDKKRQHDSWQPNQNKRKK